MKSESIKFVDITNNPHFSQFAALLSVPFHSRHWREAHPHVPFWTLWDDCVKLQKEEFFEDGATAFISRWMSVSCICSFPCGFATDYSCTNCSI